MPTDAVREYKDAPREGEVNGMWYDGMVDAELADAAIAELEAENLSLKWMLDESWRRSGEAWNWPKDKWLADLAAHYEKEQG